MSWKYYSHSSGHVRCQSYAKCRICYPEHHIDHYLDGRMAAPEQAPKQATKSRISVVCQTDGPGADEVATEQLHAQSGRSSAGSPQPAEACVGCGARVGSPPPSGDDAQLDASFVGATVADVGALKARFHETGALRRFSPAPAGRHPMAHDSPPSLTAGPCSVNVAACLRTCLRR
jgi:hypothetical protein